jgi:tetratricopeptide (TPR) repeat protein
MVRASERQLSVWERKGWIQPTFPPGSASGGGTTAKRNGGRSSQEPQPAYTFEDVATLKTILQLRQSGIPAKFLSSFREGLRSWPSPTGRSPSWNDLQIHTTGKRVSVSYRGTRMEPLTGQLLLEFAPRREQSNLVRIDSSSQLLLSREAKRRAHADRLFLAGLRYEERPETIPRAIRAYKKATELNPRAVGAFINLGTIHYHQGMLEEAERNYQAALSLNPGSALVHFNVGNLLEEKGELEAARSEYEEAIRLDSAYPDPRFNLALLYERLGRHGKACQQWRAYLKLDSESRWAAHAKHQLAQLPLRVVSDANPSNESG